MLYPLFGLLTLLGYPAEAARLRWTLPARGAIVAFDASPAGIIIATEPNSDVVEGGSGSSVRQIRFLDWDGKIRWSYSSQARIRDLSLSSDGRLTAIATHAGEIIELDDQGKKLWSFAKTCAPIVLNPQSKVAKQGDPSPMGGQVLCYHNDDPEPQIAFDVIGNEGQHLLSYPIPGDILALRPGGNMHLWALGLTAGIVQIVGASWVAEDRFALSEEILDVALGDQIDTQGRTVLAVLSTEIQPKGSKELSPPRVFLNTYRTHPAKLLQRLELPFRATELQITPNGQTFYYAANGPLRQMLGGGPTMGNGAHWQITGAPASAYSVPIQRVEDRIYWATEDITSRTRLSRIRSYRPDGLMQSEFTLPRSIEATTYQFRVFERSLGTDSIVAITDDGLIHVFEESVGAQRVARTPGKPKLRIRSAKVGAARRSSRRT